MNRDILSRKVKETAARLGFDECGIAEAVPLDEDARRLSAWLERGMHGSMKYMERYFELRVNPYLLVPGARSVITLILNYFPEEEIKGDLRISKYAYGKDYHQVIREKLNLFLESLREQVGNVEGRGFVDSAPVLERTWASRSGLGWIGKNGNFITTNKGSYFFIATLISDLDLRADDAFAKDYCGTCTKCIDACPTEAILPGRIVDGSKCISYYTIELKDEIIPQEAKGKFDGWMFGCDTCQDVCPWNRFAKPHDTPEFNMIPGLLNLSTREWMEMTEEMFKKMFRDSPIKRTKFEGIRRNVKFLLEG